MSTSILKRPVVVLMLPILIATFVVLVSWLVYFNPTDTDIEKQIAQLKQDIAIVDKQLFSQKQYERNLHRHIGLKETSIQIHKGNTLTRNFLAMIMGIEKTGNSLVSIQSSNQQSLQIIVQITDQVSFYRFVEEIENMPATDRVVINKSPDNNKQFILTLFTTNNSGEAE